MKFTLPTFRLVDEQQSSRRGAALLLLLSFALVILAGGAAAYSTARMTTLEAWVSHTFNVREAAQRLVVDLLEAESAQRGLTTSGNPALYAPFEQAMADVPVQMAELRRLTGDNLTQQRALDTLESAINAKTAFMHDIVEMVRRDGPRQVQIRMRNGPGIQLMEGVRDGLRTFEGREETLLRERQEAAASQRTWLMVLIIVSLGTALALALVLAFAVRDYQQRLQARTAALESEATLRRQTEDTLRQAQKIEAIGQLTGGVAHDFNNLLTIIIGNLDTIRRRLSAPKGDARDLAQQVERPLDVAQQGARNAAQLTHRLLAFARRQPLEPVRLDLNKAVSGLSDLLRRTLGETIHIEMILAGGLWPAFADANQIENALINLCINARDAMKEGGKLTIETANTFLDEAYVRQFGDVAAGQFVLLSVSDTGTGIPPDVLDRAFEPFFTTKATGEGSGLGLAMVHGFVKQSGGHIRIYSELGLGTTVKIYLPRLVQDELAATPRAKFADDQSIPIARAGEVVLVVEDNAGVRDYACSVLTELGYHVIEAGDADSALEVLAQVGRIDLLFTDVVLPGASGRQLVERMPAARASLPVLFTTGYTRNAIIHNGRLDPGVQLLGKPYTHRSLAQKVREVIDAGSSGQP